MMGVMSGTSFPFYRAVIASVIALVWFAFPRTAIAGAADNVTGWAWSAAAGWISMNSTNCEALNRGADPDPCALGGNAYGVTVASDGRVSGYAWSRVAGWMCVGVACTGSGGAAPTGGWSARVNAITGEVTGWGKLLSMGNGGWVSFSCANTATCATVAYRTTVNVATGAFSGYAWNGQREGTAIAPALGWIAWAPAFGGTTTTWRPVPLCSAGGSACQSDTECGLSGEFCCLGGAACGRCSGDGAACGSSAECGAGVLCCREGVDCGQCTQGGTACGRDADCPNRAQDSCCPSGAVCSRGNDERTACDMDGTCSAGETAAGCPLDCGSGSARGRACDGDGSCEAGEAVTTCASDCGSAGRGGSCNSNGVCEAGESLGACAADCAERVSAPPVGVCAGGGSPPVLCVDGGQCAVGAACDVELGICSSTGTVCASAAACSGGGDTCDRDLGIRTDIGVRTDDAPNGTSIPCANDDPVCRKIIGKCIGAEQLCAVDANCPAGSRCGKLYLPWVQTQFGSLYSGGSVGSSQTPPPPSGQYNATFCILSGGPIVNFVSSEGCGGVRRTPYPKAGQPLILPKLPAYVSTAARLDVAGIVGGRYGRLTQTLPTLASFVGGYQLGGKIFFSPTGGDHRLGAAGKTIRFVNGVGSASGAGLFIIRGGNLLIESDIEYGGGQLGDIRGLASVGFLVLKDRVRDADGNMVEVGGDIIIHPSVQRLVGAFYAEGEIRTGTTGRAASDRALAVSGVMVARKFRFERLYASAKPAEQITADGRVLANPPPGFGDLARSLPLITQTAP